MRLLREDHSRNIRLLLASMPRFELFTISHTVFPLSVEVVDQLGFALDMAEPLMVELLEVIIGDLSIGGPKSISCLRDEGSHYVDFKFMYSQSRYS